MYQEINEIATKDAASLVNHLERTQLTTTEKQEAVSTFRLNLIGCNAVTVTAVNEILSNYLTFLSKN